MLLRRILFYSVFVLCLSLAGAWFIGALRREASHSPVPSANGSRAHEPRRPFPYVEEEVIVRNEAASVSLAGTFTRPRAGSGHPAVVLIAGTGPQDRDSSGAGHRPFLVLADHLTRHGIAVLRCDRRGTGASSGRFELATESDFVDDTLSALAWLRGRSEIDPRRVGLIGHSQGGVIALRTHAQAPDLAFLVLLASPGLPLVDVKAGQFRAAGRAFDIEAALIEHWVATYQEYARLAADGHDADATDRTLRELWRRRVLPLSESERRKLGIGDTAFDAMLAEALQPGFVSALRTDPRPLLATVRCPVLALHGKSDMQVDAKENLAAIRTATAGRARTIALPRLNHLFQTARTGHPDEYPQIEETFAPAALSLIAEWIRETAK